MRILLLNKYWRPAGGVEVHALEVANWLTSLGHEIVPFAMQEPDTFDSAYSRYFPEPVEFRGSSVKETAKGVIRATHSGDARRSLQRLIQETKPDAAYVLHVYHQLGTSLLNELHKQQVPMVLSLHDYKIACPNYRLYSENSGNICTTCLDSRFGYLGAPATKKCWNDSRGAGIALSAEALFTRVRGSYRLPGTVTILNSIQRRAALHAGVAEERIMLLPHPVELGPARVAPDNAPFLYVGRLVPEKGVDVLIRATAEAGQRLTVVGDGRSRAELEQLATQLNAAVTFAGSASHDEVATLMRSSRAVVVPSTWHEVSPLVVYEAISNDVPVIASRVGGMIDQIGDGRGYLVEAGNVTELALTMSAVASSPEKAQERSKAAREYAQAAWSRETWEANMRKAFENSGVTL